MSWLEVWASQSQSANKSGNPVMKTAHGSWLSLNAVNQASIYILQGARGRVESNRRKIQPQQEAGSQRLKTLPCKGELEINSLSRENWHWLEEGKHPPGDGDSSLLSLRFASPFRTIRWAPRLRLRAFFKRVWQCFSAYGRSEADPLWKHLIPM